MVKAKTKTKASKQTKKLTQVLQTLDKTAKLSGSRNVFNSCRGGMYCV